MKILIIDDDKEWTSLLTMQMADHFHQTDTATDGVIGEQMALANEYDAIILDVMIPGADGFLVCKTLRKNGINVPIIMVTSLESPEEERAGYIAGTTDYLIKPVEFEELYKNLLTHYMKSTLRV